MLDLPNTRSLVDRLSSNCLSRALSGARLFWSFCYPTFFVFAIRISYLSSAARRLCQLRLAFYESVDIGLSPTRASIKTQRRGKGEMRVTRIVAQSPNVHIAAFAELGADVLTGE